jgi:hypothetical protein
MSGNFPRDLYGPVDTRDLRPSACAGSPCIWGRSDQDSLPIKFFPPSGYHVKILALRGDLVSWIKTLPGDVRTPDESSAGVLLGFQVPNPRQALCSFCEMDCPLYIQDSVSKEMPRTRAPFNYENVDLILGDTNTLVLKLASWLNTTGKPIHLEGTYTVKFTFVKAAE